MNLIRKVKRKIRKNSNNNDNVSLLDKKGNKRKFMKNNSSSYEESCSVTASLSSGDSTYTSTSLLFDELDNEYNNFSSSSGNEAMNNNIHSTRSRSFKSIKGLSYSPLKSRVKSKGSTSSSDISIKSDEIIEEESSHVCEKEEHFALVRRECNNNDETDSPSDEEDNNSINMIVTVAPTKESNDNNNNDTELLRISPPSDITNIDNNCTHDLPPENQQAIELHSKLEIVSDFDRFVSFFSDTIISNLCESPTVGSTIQNTASSFFNFSSSDNDNQKTQLQIEQKPSPDVEKTQIVEYAPKTPPRPVDALADENGLVHIFHDRLSTLYETPENSMDEKAENTEKNDFPPNSISTLEDEDIIKARWAYAVEMMTLDAQCGSFSDAYEVAEI